MTVTSALDRHSLLQLLAEMLLGVEIGEIERPPDEEVLDSMIADSYFLEPADPSKLEPDGSIGIDTPMRTSEAGRELGAVGYALDDWLGARPEGPVGLGADGGDFISALIGGWATTVLHHLALTPRSVEEVCDTCEAAFGIGEEIVKAWIAGMDNAKQLQAFVDDDGETRYGLTDWLREAIVPLVLAARLEHRHPRGDTLPVDRLDVEAIFASALSLITVDPRLEGSCRLLARLAGEGDRLGGVTTQLRAGKAGALDTDVESDTHATLAGSADAWLEALVSGKREHLEIDGDREIAEAIFDAIHQRLFADIRTL